MTSIQSEEAHPTPNPKIIIDNGTAFIKAGPNNAPSPAFWVPNVVGKPKGKNIWVGMMSLDSVVGLDYMKSPGRPLMPPHYCMTEGLITNYYDQENLWSHTFSVLRVDLVDHSTVMTESIFAPFEQRKWTYEDLFEHMTPSVCLISTASAVLMDSRKTTGLVVESGAGVTSIVPIYEGVPILEAAQKCDVSLTGKEMDNHLISFIQGKGTSISRVQDKDVLTALKHTPGTFYVASDAAEYKSLLEKGVPAVSAELLNGEQIELSHERIMCPEIMFQPSIVKEGIVSIQEAVIAAVKKCDVEIQATMLKNIVVAGGNTMFEGFPERLEKEVASLMPEQKVTVTAPSTRTESAWRGASLFSYDSNYEQMAITIEEYQESGESCILRRKRC